MYNFITQSYKSIFYIAIFFLAGITKSLAQQDDLYLYKKQFIEKLSASGHSGVAVPENSVDLKIRSDASDASRFNKIDDAFHINADNHKISISAATVKGLKNGMYWYLQFLGYRFYFPNDAWYYIPELPGIYKPVDTVISPSFTYRRIWYAYGTASARADADYKFWADANLLGGEDVSAGHAYDGIVKRNKAVFLNNPQFFAQKTVAGQIPKNPKFEVVNEQLVTLVINDALQQISDALKKIGSLPGMISMDPSDGGGESTSPASLKIGGASEQTFYLANRVAKAIGEKHPSVKVGLYAYNQHAVPPDFKLEKNIVVLIATAMNQSKYKTNELIDLWKKKGVQVGIRDYYGVMAWDMDMPGMPNGSKLSYVSLLKTYFANGIKLFSAETNIGWISRGLGHYVAARLLWNINENVDELKDEFYNNIFAKAAAPMRELFEKWQVYKQPIPAESDLKTWYALLQKAATLENNSSVQNRLSQIKHYLHYVMLYKNWKEENNNANKVNLLTYAYRIQDEGSVASYPLFRRLANVSKESVPSMSFKNGNAVWKNNKNILSPTETDEMFFADMKSLKNDDVSIERELPVTLNQSGIKKINSSPQKLNTSPEIKLRGLHKVIFTVQPGNAFINLTAGLIKAKEFKKLQVTIYPYNKQLDEKQAAVLTEVVMPQQPLKAISLNTLKAGSYFAVINDSRNGFSLSFSGEVTYGILAGEQNRLWSLGRNKLVFKIDQVKQFRIINNGALTLISPAGRTVDLQNKKGETLVDVLDGEEGLWKIINQNGVFDLKGILPIVSTSNDFLLNID